MSDHKSDKPVYYQSLDGIRVIAAVLIIIMHVDANSSFEVNNIVYTILVSKFGYLVYLFMILSAFSMCCAYFDKIKNGEITLESFFRKRFKKIWPFFAVIVIVECIYEHTVVALVESFADLTMAFALLPNPDISIAGIGWFLGVVFLFYMLFPYFVFLLSNKKRAWTAFLCSILFNVICILYFYQKSFVTETFWPKRNILFCSMFFFMGGILYLYREKISNLSKSVIAVLFIAFILTLCFFVIDFIDNDVFRSFNYLILFSLIIILSINSSIPTLRGRLLGILRKLSFEIYLSHMVVFRIIHKLNFLRYFPDNDIIQCIILNFSTVGGQ